MRLLLISLLLGAVASFPGVALPDSEGPTRPTLRFDPFAHPDSQAGGRGREVERGRDWAPVLKATLVAGPESMANLGGTILGLGEETHGYRLLEVREREAVFQRRDSRVVLTLDPGEER